MKLDTETLLHLQSCNESACICKAMDVKACSELWTRRLPVISCPSLCNQAVSIYGASAVAAAGSWLYLKPTVKRQPMLPTQTTKTLLGFGCWVCYAHGRRRHPFSQLGTDPSKFRIDHLVRHQQCQCHLQAVRDMLQLPSQGPPRQEAKPAPKAPSFQDVLAVLRSLQKGVSPSQGTDSMHKHKTFKVVWCLAESLKRTYRTHLRDAVTVNILRDERHKRLQVRWRCCDEHSEAPCSSIETCTFMSLPRVA